MALRVEETFVVLRAPVAYSFWASMIIRVLSAGEAVEGGRPIRARKDWGGMVGGRPWEGGLRVVRERV